MKIATKRMTFRLDNPLYDFMNNFAKKNGTTISELIRDICIYFHLGILTGDIQKTLPQLKKEFVAMDLKHYKDNRKRVLAKKN
jgi:hypothetical protein